MSTRPTNRSGFSFCADTRWHIAPTVRQATRANVDTVVLSARVVNHTTRSSKSVVKPEPARANGTACVSTPWEGQANRRRRILTYNRCPPRSRCLHRESTPRLS